MQCSVFSIRTRRLCIGFAVLFAFFSCNQENKWEAERDSLIRQSEQWNRRFDHLNHNIDSLWDVTSAALEKGMPANFPTTDRDIFLHSRNADHIRMFMSYKTLDTTLQHLVIDAGHKDSLLAAEMRQLHLDKNALEDSISDFLQQVVLSDPAAGRRYAGQFAAVSTLSNQQ